MSLPTRRDFLGTLGAAAAAVPALGSTALGAGGQGTASYDLVIKGGRVIDPSQKLNGALDVARLRVDNLFGGPTQAEKVMPQILELKDRGIYTEGQMVNSHHMFEVSEKAFAQGWIPDLLGTDMGAVGRDMPNGILLPWEMTQYLYLGLTVEQVGTLATGAPGDVTIIDLQQGQFQRFDQKGGTLAKIDPAVHETKFAGVRV